MKHQTLLIVIIASVLSSAFTLAASALLLPRTADAQAPGVLTGSGLNIVDAQGRSRLVVQTTPSGDVMLLLADDANTPRVLLGSTAGGGSSLGFYDANGKEPRVFVSSDAGGPWFSLNDPSGTGRFVVGQGQQGAYGLRINDPTGRAQYVAP